MSRITDELRDWVSNNYSGWPSKQTEGFAIADRIDAEYEEAENKWIAKNGDMWFKGYGKCHAEMMEGNGVLAADLEANGWIKLPVDVSGVPIRIEDSLVLQHEVQEKPFSVQSLTWDGEDWYFTCDEGLFNACGWAHHHEPTVEDVLDEMLQRFAEDSYEGGLTDFIAKYAAKLQLKEDR